MSVRPRGAPHAGRIGAHHRVLVIEHELRSARASGLADAGGAEEDEAADPGAGLSGRSARGGWPRRPPRRPMLAMTRSCRRSSIRELLGLLLEHPGDGDAGPVGDDRRHVLGVDGVVDLSTPSTVFASGSFASSCSISVRICCAASGAAWAPAGLSVSRNAPAQPPPGVAGGQVSIRSLLAASSITSMALSGACGRNVAVRGSAAASMASSLIFAPGAPRSARAGAQDIDGLLHGRLFDDDGLEAPFERRVFLDVLGIVEGGGADGLQLAAGERGLELLRRPSPSAAPAPTTVYSSSMNTMILPSAARISSMTVGALELARALLPAIIGEVQRGTRLSPSTCGPPGRDLLGEALDDGGLARTASPMRTGLFLCGARAPG